MSRYNESTIPAGYVYHVTLGWCTSYQSCGATVELFSLYNAQLNDHMVTTEAGERDHCVSNRGYIDLGGRSNVPMQMIPKKI